MKPELIIMLTHMDSTVPNALEIFNQTRDAPVTFWGFKDVGLPPEQMKALVSTMKDAGKTTCLEVVSLSEEEGLRGASLAVEAGFDILMGTVYYESIGKFMQGKPIKYYPFPGHVHSHPSILDGTIEEIVEHCKFLESKNADGLDLLAYRYTGDARDLLKPAVKSVNIPICSAGSVATFQRIAEIWDAGTWGFTIGSAFFDGKFVPGGTFTENAWAVCNWLEEAQESKLPEYLALDH
jgi:hypothetical protein